MERLARSSPDAAGIGADGIHEFIGFLDQHVKMNSVMIVKNHRVVAEGWWAPYAPHKVHALFSASKTYTALAVGFAVQDGLLNVDDRVITFFPDRLGYACCENMERMTVEHLLTMTSGMTEDPHDFIFEDNEDWVYRFLRLYVPNMPGEKFLYNTHASYMLSAIVQKVTGMTTEQYLKEKLFRPLGYSQDTWWECCPMGVSTGGWGLSVTTEDYAKLGLFLMDHGTYDGKRLLDPAWVDRAVSKQVDSFPPEKSVHESYGYGYQIWRGRHNSFRASGGFGQYCCVYPDEDLVVATTAGEFQCPDSILDAVEQYLLPACKNAYTDSGRMQKPLEARLMKLGIPLPRETETGNSAAVQHSGVRYLLSPSHLDYRSVRMTFGEDQDQVEFGYFDRTFTVPVGHGRWLEAQTCVEDRETDTDVSIVYRDVSCAGGWVSECCYELKMCFDRTPFVDTWRFHFQGGTLIADYRRSDFFPGQSLDVTLYGMAESAVKNCVPKVVYHIHYGFQKRHFGKPLK